MPGQGDILVSGRREGIITLRQVTTAGDIEKLADRLSGIRQQMDVALLYLLLSVVPPVQIFLYDTAS